MYRSLLSERADTGSASKITAAQSNKIVFNALRLDAPRGRMIYAAELPSDLFRCGVASEPTIH